MKIKLVPLVLLANVVFMHCQLRQRTMHVTSEEATGLILSVGSYTPLKDAIDYLNHEYGWLVSYEDPLYLDSQVEDIAVPSWRKAHPGERGFYVPKWTELKLRITKPTGQAGDQVTILGELVQQYNQLNREDKFSVRTFSKTRTAVVGNIRGVDVMGHATVLPQKLERNGSEEMRRLTEECGAQMRMRLVIGTNGAVDSLRSAVHHPTWTAANVLLSFFAIAAVFERSMFDFSWALLIVVQTMLEIRNAVRPSRKPPGPGTRIDWGNGAPLRSDHWGER